MNAPERVLRKITSDSLATYLAEVRRQSVPTPAEELTLGHRIRAGDAEALRELVERNLRFVVQVANKYKGYGLPLADLINEGNLGLLHAAGKFDPEHGTRFITYAGWWFRQAIRHARGEGGGPVRCPIKQAEALARVRQTYGPPALRQGVQNGLTNPPHGVGDEARAVFRVELTGSVQ